MDGCFSPARAKSRPLHIKGRRPKKRGKAGSWDGFPVERLSAPVLKFSVIVLDAIT
jgi:hypothetical protein